MKLACFAAMALALLVSAGADAQSDAPVQFVFFADSKPLLIDLQAEIDGKPARTVWTAYMRRWFDLLDRDRDGDLNAKEMQNAPADDVLWQTMRQGFYFPRQGLPAANRLQATGDKATFDDFLRYYQKKAGPYQFGAAVQYNNVSSTMLQRWLDRNNDKVLTKEELLRAAEAMDSLDKSDDEIITADELGGNAAANFGNQFVVLNGGAQPAQTTGSDSFLHIDETSTAKMALLLLTHYDRDADKALQPAESGLGKDAFQRTDANRDGKLDIEELAHWHERAADLRLVTRSGRTMDQQPRVQADVADKFPSVRETDGGVLATAGDAQITFKAESDAAGQVNLNRSQFFMQAFQQIDKNKQKFIEMKDLQNNNQANILKIIFPLTDVNDDSKMTEDELRSFLTLQEGAKDCFAVLSVAEEGRAFFQILDANRDSRLSLRELRTAWSRMQQYDADKDDAIGNNEVARQFQLSVQRGQNAFYRPNVINPGMGAPAQPPLASRDAPLWFRKMDQNNDGDVSPREFLGSREQFERIDTDGDRMISPTEATKTENR